MMLTISRLDAPLEAKRQHVNDKTFIVGGVPGVCDLVLQDPEVSPVHARITVRGLRIVIEDLGSTGGTFVNGQRIAGLTIPREGDVILVGGTVLRFTTPSRRSAASAALEGELLDALRTDPADDVTRMVYADWLEHHDHPLRATVVRLELQRGLATTSAAELAARVRALYPATDPDWRATVSRAEIEKCPTRGRGDDGGELAFECPTRWSALAPTADPRVRDCAACAQQVFYCRDLTEVRTRGNAGQCVAFDAALVRAQAIKAYENPYPLVRMGRVSLRQR